jgi:uncharacterized membrane protein
MTLKMAWPGCTIPMESDSAMASCTACGVQIPDGATCCPACAGVASVMARARMSENLAGTLAYVTAIPAIIFLVLEPYKNSRFVRFHSWQCIMLVAAMILAHIVLSFFAASFLIIVNVLLHMMVSGATVLALILLALKANQGRMPKLPVIGDLAEKQADVK